MIKCKNCMHYDKEYDEFRQQYDDIIIIGQENRKVHHCILYDNEIPSETWKNKEECPDFFDKKDCPDFFEKQIHKQG